MTQITQHQLEQEQRLAAKAREGCGRSFGELDKLLRPRLVHLLVGRVKNHADAEDLAQQTLWKAWQRIEQYDPKRRFAPWLFAIAMRLATDAYRQYKQVAVSLDEVAMQTVDTQPQPHETLAQREASNELWEQARRLLGEPAWTVLWLTYGESCKPREIAKVVGTSATSVRVALWRARKQMAQHLESDEYAPTHRTTPAEQSHEVKAMPANQGVA